MIVLGIDPGPEVCGWALLDILHMRPAWMNGGSMLVDSVFNQLTIPELVCVEKPSAIHPGVDGHRVKSGNVIDCAFAAGRVFQGWRELVNTTVMAVSAKQVRASLLGVAKPGNQDAALKALLENLIIGRPKRWNNHMRDAAAVAIVGHRMYPRAKQ